jgi:hypothetical protein
MEYYKESLSEIINVTGAKRVYQKTLEIHQWFYQTIRSEKS